MRRGAKPGATYLMNRGVIESSLSRARLEQGVGRIQDGVELWIPMPDGEFRRFSIVESPVMEAGLAARFPEIKTYRGVGVEHPGDVLRVDMNRRGLHVQVLSSQGNAYIDPVDAEAGEYVAYYSANALRSDEEFDCLTDASTAASASAPVIAGIQSDGMSRVYRLAVAATGEYTQFHGGTVAAGLSAIVTAVNRLNGIYESELSIRFVLVANNDRIIYTNAVTDSYSNTNGVAMLSQNQVGIDAVIGSANYDIGHVFSTGGGGIAQLNSVCVPGWKAMGVTGRASPVGDSFYIDYFAHEIGHQFGAHHTFNGVAGSCNANNRHADTAYEPGSGSTIMSYSGICGSDNLQYGSDPYFHSASLNQIRLFISSTCPAPVVSANHPPTVNAGPDYVIPGGTPFELKASGSDPDGDALTYCWEQLDLGAAAALLGQDAGSGPLFRSFPPVSTPSRVFPRLTSLLAGQASPAEVLPTTSRTLHFRVTARDNRSGGGAFGMDEMQVAVAAGAGPFALVAPDSSAVLSGQQTVRWNVAGTDLSPIGVSAVDILLSTNGGQDFPILLAAGTPNDGAEQITLPNAYVQGARFKVRAVGNIFFDVSKADCSIVPEGATPIAYVTVVNTFSNLSRVLIPAVGTKGNASQFPLPLLVNGVQGVVQSLTVQLHGLTHGFVDDLDILLVGPGGERVMLLSDSSGGALADHLELTFRDDGAAFPNNGSLNSGVYQPSNVGATGDSFPVTGPYSGALSVFNTLDPNGTWSLYLVDDSSGDLGELAGGWTLRLETLEPVAPTNAAPVILAQPVHFVHAGATLVVTNQASDPDNSGALVFALRPGAPAGVVLDGNGVLVWSPDTTLIGTTNVCTVSVTDSGSPSMSSESEVAMVVVGGPVIHSLELVNGEARLRWSSIPGARYRLECADNLLLGNWLEAAPSQDSMGFVTETACPTGPAGQRFFRIRVEP
jgi:hypothetical protein